MQPETQNQSVQWGGNADVAVSQNKVLRNTYMLLAVSLVPTILGAFVGSFINLSFLRTSPIISETPPLGAPASRRGPRGRSFLE